MTRILPLLLPLLLNSEYSINGTTGNNNNNDDGNKNDNNSK